MTAVLDSDLFQVAQLVEQLRHDDIHHRVIAVKNVPAIAAGLGAERTRAELIPFLNESTDDERDVIAVIAEKLGELPRYVGGKEYVYLILPPLETLVLNELPLVRDNATNSLRLCAEAMSSSHIMMYYVPLVTKLARKDLFIGRVAATFLLHIGYSKLPDPVKAELSSLYLNLCNDLTPLVRRAAAINFPKMIKVVSPPHLQTDYVAAFHSLSSHDQEAIRIQCIPICIAMAEILSPDLRLTKVLPVVAALAKDKAWRVRYSLVSRLHEILSCLLAAEVQIAAMFDALLQDAEAEVRGAAAASIAPLCRGLSKDLVLSKLINSIQRLTTDLSESVRSATALGLGSLVVVLGKDETIEFILPMLLALLRDEVAEVRLNVISRLDLIHQVLGVEVLSQSLLPAIAHLAVDGKWRVRLMILEHIPLLLDQMTAAFFADRLSDMCLAWLFDPVFAVRCAAVENVRLLHSRLGDTWTLNNVSSKVELLTSNRNYLLRLTGLHLIQTLCPLLSIPSIEKLLVPKSFHLVKDPVPNVRMNCCKSLVAIFRVLPAANNNREIIIHNLNELVSDPDRDVKGSAEKVITVCLSSNEIAP